jgi:hypothetical protein
MQTEVNILLRSFTNTNQMTRILCFSFNNSDDASEFCAVVSCVRFVLDVYMLIVGLTIVTPMLAFDTNLPCICLFVSCCVLDSLIWYAQLCLNRVRSKRFDSSMYLLEAMYLILPLSLLILTFTLEDKQQFSCFLIFAIIHLVLGCITFRTLGYAVKHFIYETSQNENQSTYSTIRG